jgi:hypothetical protein
LVQNWVKDLSFCFANTFGLLGEGARRLGVVYFLKIGPGMVL